MIRKSRLTAALLAALALTPLCAQPTAKRRVAVLNFDYATVQNDVRAIFGGNQDVGKGIADLIVARLVESGVYSVIERKALDKIMAEQNFSNSDRADATTAAKIGKLLGVDAILVGSITQFGRDDKTTNVGGGALSGITGRYGIGGVGKRSAKAVVGLTARLVNVNTGEIVAIASGKGESTRSGATLLGSGGAGTTAAGGAVDMSSKNFADTILGEAVSQAVNGLSTQLDQGAGKIPVTVVAIEGLIADVNGSNLIINVGSKAGVRVGDKLKVARTGRSITDPATGRVLRRVEDEIGEMVITDVDEQSAGGTFTGRQPAKVGDRVKQ
jgi:curli biogenesis system outer membrane secretion channel CsgG